MPDRRRQGEFHFDLSAARLHDVLLTSLELYRHLSAAHQANVREFVARFYDSKTVLFHPEVDDRETLLAVTAGCAALVGSAQPTQYFASVKWLYFCLDDLEVDGDALQASTVRLNAELCLEEAAEIVPGCNVIVHEFAHVLDAQLGIHGSTPVLRQAYQQYLQRMERDLPDAIADCLTPMEMALDDWHDADDSVFRPEPEFFAVACEAFFTNAVALRAAYPPLYRELAQLFGLDMAEYLSAAGQC